jgi:hypothetical protein
MRGRFWTEDVKGRAQSEDLPADWRIILELEKGGNLWTECI